MCASPPPMAMRPPATSASGGDVAVYAQGGDASAAPVDADRHDRRPHRREHQRQRGAGRGRRRRHRQRPRISSGRRARPAPPMFGASPEPFVNLDHSATLDQVIANDAAVTVLHGNLAIGELRADTGNAGVYLADGALTVNTASRRHGRSRGAGRQPGARQRRDQRERHLSDQQPHDRRDCGRQPLRRQLSLHRWRHGVGGWLHRFRRRCGTLRQHRRDHHGGADRQARCDGRRGRGSQHRADRAGGQRPVRRGQHATVPRQPDRAGRLCARRDDGNVTLGADAGAVARKRVQHRRSGRGALAAAVAAPVAQRSSRSAAM